jgi:hypothetical protein
MKLALLTILIITTACGSYQFGKGTRTIPGGYDRVAVPMFVNKTKEVGIEPYFTEGLRTEFERGHTASVTSVADAQLIIEGIITGVIYTPTIQLNSQSTGLTAPPSHLFTIPVPGATPPAFAQQTNPLPSTAVLNTQYQIVVTVKIIARKTSDQTILWTSDFTSQRQYLAPLLGTPVINTAAPLYNQNSRTEVIATLAHDMMTEAHDRLTENF